MDKLKQFEEVVRRHSLNEYDVFFSSNALIGEVGELANALKKDRWVKDHPSWRRNMKSSIEYHENAIDEAGDVLFYYLQVLQKAGIDIEHVIDQQILKLQKQSIERGVKFYKK